MQSSCLNYVGKTTSKMKDCKLFKEYKNHKVNLAKHLMEIKIKFQKYVSGSQNKVVIKALLRKQKRNYSEIV